jgi:endonuclease-3
MKPSNSSIEQRDGKSNVALVTRTLEIMKRLEREYPGSAKDLCALTFNNPFELLVATILSAQCTDQRVNMVTPRLFEKYPTPEAMASADIEDVADIIKSTGFFHSKASNIIKMAAALVQNFSSNVPADIEKLVTLSGVGRKTANVVLSVGFSLPGLPVDTHVKRLSKRLALTAFDDPEKIEADLNKLVGDKDRGAFSLRLILHGRKVCIARKPKCEECILADICPSSRMPVVDI